MTLRGRDRQRFGRRALTPAQVRRLGRYATHRSVCGCVFEFAEGRFWVTPSGAPDGRREIEEHHLPRGPWFHHSLCDCEACRRS